MVIEETLTVEDQSRTVILWYTPYSTLYLVF